MLTSRPALLTAAVFLLAAGAAAAAAAVDARQPCAPPPRAGLRTLHPSRPPSDACPCPAPRPPHPAPRTPQLRRGPPAERPHQTGAGPGGAGGAAKHQGARGAGGGHRAVPLRQELHAQPAARRGVRRGVWGRAHAQHADQGAPPGFWWRGACMGARGGADEPHRSGAKAGMGDVLPKALGSWGGWLAVLLCRASGCGGSRCR